MECPRLLGNLTYFAVDNSVGDHTLIADFDSENDNDSDLPVAKSSRLVDLDYDQQSPERSVERLGTSASQLVRGKRCNESN